MEAVLINTSGGLTGGDRIDWSVNAAAGTDITVTTQACERIYKSSGGEADIAVKLVAGPGAKLFWLPQETILFNQGRLTRRLEADLATDAELVVVESVLFGRKAMGEDVAEGLLSDQWRIRRDGRLIHAEALRLEGPVAFRADRATGLDGDRAFANVLYCGPRAEALASGLKGLLDDRIAGFSAFADKIVIRMIASEGFDLRKILIPVVSHLRDGGSLPKVWSL